MHQAATVRRLAPDDWEALRVVRLAALADSPDAFASTLEAETAYDEATWRSRLAGGAYFLAEIGGEACGLVAVISTSESPEDELHLVAMWVAPAYRGQGLARALCTEVFAVASERGAREVVLWVADGNERAAGVYEWLGFRRTGERQELPNHPGIGEEKMSLVLAGR